MWESDDTLATLWKTGRFQLLGNEATLVLAFAFIRLVVICKTWTFQQGGSWEYMMLAKLGLKHQGETRKSSA